MPNDAVEISIGSASITIAAGKVKVSADDTTSGFLEEKIVGGTGITVSVIDVDGVETLRISSTGGVGDANVNTTITPFSYLSGYPLLIRNIPDGYTVTTVRVVITTEFDGTASIKVGSPGRIDCLMLNIDNDPYTQGSYESWPSLTYTGGDQINLYLVTSGSTQGTGVIYATMQVV